MAQAGQTHRRQTGTKGKAASSNGRASSNGKARASSNGHNGQEVSSSASKNRGSGTASKNRSSSSANKSRSTSARKSQRRPQQKSERKRPQPSRSRQSKQSKQGVPTPDPRWGLVPVTAAGIGGAAWAILRRRRRKRRPSRLPDLDSARKVLGRELRDVTGVAQTAGRTTGRLLRSRVKDGENTAKSAGRSTGRFLRSGAKDAQRATRSAGKEGTRFLRRGAKEIQGAMPQRRKTTPAAQVGRALASGGEQLTSHGQRLASRIPSRAQDAWPLVSALVPGAAYSAARLRAAHRLPIQCSVDVAVPIQAVYDQWMQLNFLPEGGHCVTEIERTDDELAGKISGPLRSREWEAEILDERDCESFAWRSTEGSDCAGLITFHQLGERLTRLELQLDVLPVRSPEALALSLHTADRRANAQLRRFKARVETMSPDVYEDGRETDQTDQDEDKED